MNAEGIKSARTGEVGFSVAMNLLMKESENSTSKGVRLRGVFAMEEETVLLARRQGSCC